MATTALRPTGPAVVLHGTPVVPGAGTGPVVRPAPRPALPLRAVVADAVVEAARVATAAELVATRLAERAAASTGVAAEVLSATAGLARDRGLLGAVRTRVERGLDGPHALEEAVAQFSELFRGLGGLMAERVTDLQDVRDRVLAELLGLPEPGIPQPAVPSVLLADDLAPADTAGLDPSRVVALATRLGGPTSHTAIIARALGLPCVVAVEGLDAVPEGAHVLVDGSAGSVVVDPDPGEAERVVSAARAEQQAVAQWRGPGRLADGAAVAVLANVQDGASARAAAAGQAEGVGLFRTEMCFLSTTVEPSVEEQARQYAEVLEAFRGRPVVVRTLDAGSDKPLPYASLPDETNPALGVRGLRTAERDPGLLTRQLDALALAAERTGCAPKVMAPMVATLAEATGFAAAVRARGLVPGVMVEVPAAALVADRLLEVVDFLSLGTNDLAQYAMAADRLSPELAALTDAWQPAVLALVAMTARAGRAAGKPVGVCGEAAADPLLACVLAGLGVTSLSAAAPAVPAVGASLARATSAQCRVAADAALAADGPGQARAAARQALSR